VFMNGLLLDLTVDYTSNGSAVTLTSGAAAGDEIEVVAYNTFSVGDALNQAAADTRYVNTTGDTMTGDLGIGGTATDTAWNTQTYGNREVAIDGGGGYGVLHLRGDGAGSTNTRYSMGVGDSNFYMAYDDVAGAHRIKINSSGHVTMPSNPAFRVYNTASQQASSSDEIITWQAEELDRGGNFASNVFTAPVTGVYSFNCQFLSTNNSAQTTLYIKVGSSSVSYARSALTASNNHRTTNLSWIGTVTAGTAVGVYISDSGAYIYGDASGDWTHFQGFLIG